MSFTEYIVPAESPTRRLDVFLAHALPRGSREYVRRLLATDAVRVNGRRRPKGALLQPGDIVHVDEPATPQELAANPELHVPVLYEDADVIAVDKPAGMPSQAVRTADRETVANFLLARYPEVRTVGTDPREAGLVHRLDTETSGVLLVARNQPAYTALRRQFADRRVAKEYLAMVEGAVVAAGEITAPLAHDRRNPRRMRVCRNADEARARGARPAVTRYRPVERFATETLLAIEIPTGVMHQIRAHLASIGHAVVGDALYGARQHAPHLLHAQSVTFTHPRTAKRVRVESPVPAGLLEHLAERRGSALGRAKRGGQN